ncbi:MAG: prepilin-type N-terminal cleavage/methylation domain-containing protein [Magnetococcales bacterium]|nr:prepilin-type N-terminal cleavage/methylation domain-containing protein [Magnetococcales bacterium]
MIKKNLKRQDGFSLIEIATVLVIIGLMVGGVLKGQSMLKNAKIKRIATDTTTVQEAINAYSDAYGALPGDDPNSATHWEIQAPPTGVVATRGDDLINGYFNNTGDKVVDNPATVESAHAWNHLYCEGLIKGVCTATPGAVITFPTNPLGGITGIADGRIVINTALGLTTHLKINKKMVCMWGIPTDYAMIYDAQFDDGAGDTGDIRASGSTNGAANQGTSTGTLSAYNLGNARVFICTGF